LPELVEGYYYGCLRHGSTSSPTAQATIPGIFVFGNRLKPCGSLPQGFFIFKSSGF